MRAFAVAVFLLSSGAFFKTFFGGSEGGEPGILVVGLWTVAYAIGATSLLDGWFRRRLRVLLPLPLVLFVLLAALSYTWSYAPAVTLRRSFALTGTVVVGLALAQRLRPVELLDALRLALVIIAVTSLLLYLSGSPAAIDPLHGTLQGTMPSKNTLGRAMGLGILSAATLAILDVARRRRALVSAAVMAVPLGMAGSTGGLLLTLGIVSVIAGTMVWRSFRGRTTLVCVGALLLGFLMVTLPGMTSDEVAGVVGRDPTLTGRTDLWRHAIDAIGDEPLLGHGFGAFWHDDGPITAARISAREQWSVPHAHNGLLDLALDVGVVGAGLAAAALVVVLGRGVADGLGGHRAHAVLRLSMGGIIIASNIAESSLFDENALFTLILVVALCSPSPERVAVGLADRRPAVP